MPSGKALGTVATNAMASFLGNEGKMIRFPLTVLSKKCSREEIVFKKDEKNKTFCMVYQEKCVPLQK